MAGKPPSLLYYSHTCVIVRYKFTISVLERALLTAYRQCGLGARERELFWIAYLQERSVEDASAIRASLVN